MIDFSNARRTMIDGQLRAGGVLDLRLLSAFNAVPREDFVPQARRDIAYLDKAHPIGAPGAGRLLSAPVILARLLQLADIQPGDRVLDLGAGTGYTSAILARLSDKVVALEADKDLAALVARNLADTKVTLIHGSPEALDGQLFDAIIVDGALEREPLDLFPLLAPGGRLVATMRSGAVGIATIFVSSDDGIKARSAFNVGLPPVFSAAPVAEFVL